MEASSPVQTGTIQVTVSMETQNEKKSGGLELIRTRLLSYSVFLSYFWKYASLLIQKTVIIKRFDRKNVQTAKDFKNILLHWRKHLKGWFNNLRKQSFYCLKSLLKLDWV